MQRCQSQSPHLDVGSGPYRCACSPTQTRRCCVWTGSVVSDRCGKQCCNFGSAVFFEVSCSIGAVRSVRAVEDSLRRSFLLLVIVLSVYVFALFGSGTEVLNPFSGIGAKSFGKIWSRGCTCGLRKVWSRGPGDSVLLMTISVLLCLTRSTSFGIEC